MDTDALYHIDGIHIRDRPFLVHDKYDMCGKPSSTADWICFNHTKGKRNMELAKNHGYTMTISKTNRSLVENVNFHL